MAKKQSKAAAALDGLPAGPVSLRDQLGEEAVAEIAAEVNQRLAEWGKRRPTLRSIYESLAVAYGVEADRHKWRALLETETDWGKP